MLFRQASHQLVTIFGFGDCGKSAFVLQYAYRMKMKDARYLVLWVPAISRRSFEIAYRKIGRLFHLPGITDGNADIVELVENKLDSANSGDWLMIIDSADDDSLRLRDCEGEPEARRLSCYLPLSDRGKIIVTTRSRKATQNLTQNNIIKLEHNDVTESRQLMAQHLLEKGLLEDAAAVEELLRLLVYLPLAIVQAVTFIYSNKITIADYITVLRNPSTEAALISRHFESPSRYQERQSAHLQDSANFV